MEPQQGGAPAWPPPHPSPPEPPPREYASPGTTPDRSWVWLALGGLVVLALAVIGGVQLLGGSGADADDATDPAPTVQSTSATDEESDPALPAPVRCWDGSGEQAVDDCSVPSGAAGLAWVFPHLSEQKCGRPTEIAPDVLTRILCTTELSDGSRITLGYYEWTSVRAARAFFDDQDLESSEADGFISWTGTEGGDLKSVVLYADAPFSETVTLPADVQASEADLALLLPRPVAQLRGEPVG